MKSLLILSLLSLCCCLRRSIFEKAIVSQQSFSYSSVNGVTSSERNGGIAEIIKEGKDKVQKYTGTFSKQNKGPIKVVETGSSSIETEAQTLKDAQPALMPGSPLNAMIQNKIGTEKDPFAEFIERAAEGLLSKGNKV